MVAFRPARLDEVTNGTRGALVRAHVASESESVSRSRHRSCLPAASHS